MDSIFIRGIRFFAYHGCLSEEHALGQRFVLHLKLDLDLLPAGRSDRLEHSINYASVYELAYSIGTTRRFNLIESLAEAIAEALFERFQPIQALEITVEKPEAPIQGVFESVGITLRRNRQA